MIALIDWILSLFTNEDAARAFVAAPQQAMLDAGVSAASAAQLSAVAATAVPGLVLGGGDPIVGLQRAVANQYGFEPSYQPTYQSGLESVLAPTLGYAPNFAPAPTFAPETTTDLASHNSTDLASHNDTALFSPPQEAGANAQQGAFNLGFGDITFGGKSTTTNSASGGGVVVGHDSGAGIVSGDAAVLGNSDQITTAGADFISSTDAGSVIKGADNGLSTTLTSNVHNGASTSVGGSQTTTRIDGMGNTTTADGHESSSLATTTSTTTAVSHTVTDNSLHESVHETTVTDASTHDLSHRGLFDASQDTTLTNSTLDNGHDLTLGSHLLGGHAVGF